MEWITKEKAHAKSQYDGEIMLYKTVTKGRHIICFRFRKNSFYKVIRDGEPFAVVAKVGSRIYFKSATSNTGYKMRTIGPDQRYLRVPESKRFEIPDDALGEYNLMYDKDEGLIYIDEYAKLKREIAWERKEK